MNVTLLRPPGNGRFRRLSPPIGIHSIARYIRLSASLQGVEPCVLDLFPQELSLTDAVERVLATKPEVIGISFITAQADITYELVGALRATGRDMLLVAGGVHPSILPQEAISRGFDRVVIGEGEVAFCQILQDARMTKSRDRSRIVSARPLRSSDIPGCDWGEISSWEQYNEKIGLDGPAIPIMASRGCGFDCSFCASKVMWNRKIRWRPIEDVVAEIFIAKAKTGYSSFYFYDDDFLINRKYAEALVRKLQEVQAIQWVALSSIRSLLRCEDLLPALRKSGCIGFGIGVETADSAVLKRVGKRQKVQDTERALGLLKNHGFPHIEPLLMLFNECERPQSASLEVRLFEKIGLPLLGIDEHQYATPFPGTSFFETSKSTGIVFQRNWEDYRTDRVNFIPYTFLESPFPAEDMDPGNDIEGELDWATALDRHDGAEVASALWALLLGLEHSNILGLSVGEVVDLCWGLASRAFKHDVSKDDILRCVSLMAIVVWRLSSSGLKPQRGWS